MGREASLISISPRPNFLNPPPVPDRATEIFTAGCTALNSSATASVIGYTVLDPSMLIVPESLFSSVSSVFWPVQAARRMKMRGMRMVLEFIRLVFCRSEWIIVDRVNGDFKYFTGSNAKLPYSINSQFLQG